MAVKLRLRFESTGRVLDVAEFRRDGWPVCPGCNDDELGATKSEAGTPPDRSVTPADIDRCYRCGPVEVVSFDDGKESEPLPGIG